jgi:hypothetical protein
MTSESMPLRMASVAAISMAGLLASAAVAQGDEVPQRAMIAKWAGSYNTDGFLKEPAVRAELQKLLGTESKHLMWNLDVRGSVDLSSETLSVNGNAPHQGTEEEAIVCVTVLPSNLIVEVAILSKGAVTVFTRAEKYESASICIKDWITLVNSGHADRFQQPSNVQLNKPAP